MARNSVHYSCNEHADGISVVRHADGYVDATVAEFRSCIGFPYPDALEAAEAFALAMNRRGLVGYGMKPSRLQDQTEP
jgi:hypothetical protein